MSPFDLPGPAFLQFWLLGAAAIVAITLVVRGIVARPRLRAHGDALHPSELGYLIGGVRRALAATVAGLVHAGRVVVDGERLRATTDDVPVTLTSEAAFRGFAQRTPASRVEEHVRARLPCTGSDLDRGTSALDHELARSLEARGLLVAERAAATWMVRLPGLAWLAVGAIKVGVGIARGRPVLLLLVLVVAGAWTVFALARAPRETTLGRAVIADQRARHLGLETTARVAPQQLDPDDMTRAYALFGPVVAGAALQAVMPSDPVAGSTTSSTWGSCGSSCGGGGCGGGCGGCS